MFTLENINRGHVQFTGPDFPKLIAYFKDLSMVENTVDIQSGQVTYRSQTGQTRAIKRRYLFRTKPIWTSL